MKTRDQIEKRFYDSRNNLLVVIAFTFVNIVLAITNTDLYFLFSAGIPMYLLYLGSEYSLISGDISFSAFGVIAAFASVSIYGVFWYISKNYKGWIIAALVYYSLDALLSIRYIASIFGGFTFSLMIELLFITWMMYYRVTGTMAWYKLRTMPPDEDDEQGEQIIDGIEQDEDNQPSIAVKQNKVDIGSTIIDHKTIPVSNMPPSVAIRPPSKKGKVIIKQNYNNMEIVVKRAFGVTELIVDGMVYAERTGLNEGATYILEANVNNTVINATTEIMTMKEVTAKKVTEKDKIKDFLPIVYLYVNGNLIAEKVRYF